MSIIPKSSWLPEIFATFFVTNHYFLHIQKEQSLNFNLVAFMTYV